MAQVLECPVAELFLYNEEGVVLDITKNFSDTETAMSEIIILAEKIIKVAKCKK